MQNLVTVYHTAWRALMEVHKMWNCGVPLGWGVADPLQTHPPYMCRDLQGTVSVFHQSA